MIDVLGSIGLDVVMTCQTLPRPGETVLTQNYDLMPGGKGANQALAARRAGADVRFVASVGQDDFATRALANLTDSGVDLACVARRQAPTACATICVDAAGQNQIVVASGANLLTRAEQMAGLGDAGDVLLLQMEISLAENWQALAYGGQEHKVLNAAPYAPIPADALAALDTLIVNEVEAEMLSEDHQLGVTAPLDIARVAAERFGLTCIVTIGAEGTVSWHQGRGYRAPALALEAIDTVGAGDAFVGAYCAALQAGDGHELCLKKANIAGGLTCRFPGAQGGIPDAISIAGFLDDIAVQAL